ncbi:Flp pilus assembly protein CpaB [Pontiellaceae bacterium B12227]|nr:Flp pilus assembly protein CpaB [Pontiellaceae bacterium B12227]
MKNKTLLLLAILLGALAFIMNTRYLRSERDKLYKGAVKIQVLAAARDLPAGTELQISGENADIGVVSVYKSAVGDNVLLPSDLNRLAGKKLRHSLKRKEPVWWSHVDMPRNEATGLSGKIKYDSMGRDNYRALSVPISGAAAVSGMIKPGDYVDLLGTFTMPSKMNPQLTEQVTTTLFPKVKILAVGTKTTDDMSGMRSSGSSSVTFEVEPEVAEIIVFAQHSGQLYLTLRHPDNPDTSTPGVRIDFDTLEGLIPTINATRKFNN